VRRFHTKAKTEEEDMSYLPPAILIRLRIGQGYGGSEGGKYTQVGTVRGKVAGWVVSTRIWKGQYQGGKTCEGERKSHIPREQVDLVRGGCCNSTITRRFRRLAWGESVLTRGKEVEYVSRMREEKGSNKGPPAKIRIAPRAGYLPLERT